MRNDRNKIWDATNRELRNAVGLVRYHTTQKEFEVRQTSDIISRFWICPMNLEASRGRIWARHEELQARLGHFG